ncbi:MAG: hypothetical protein M1833_007014 [Piccolia ochrophora]|nr:MAG: hypothetical protein M1833_007014 [Piccolia ochrophora]
MYLVPRLLSQFSPQPDDLVHPTDPACRSENQLRWRTPSPCLTIRRRESIGLESPSQQKMHKLFCPPVLALASVRTDEQLENSVKQVFDQFGTVYVKIRRDNRGMPYAFCQYEEMLTNPGSLYLSKLTGGAVTESEARRVLHDYGEIDSLWWSSRTEREMYQLPEGVWVKFAFFQDCRDAQSSFRDNALYRLEQPSTPSERGAQPRTPPASRAGWTTRGATRAEAQTPQNSTYVAHRQDVDRRSVFIGNLPETMTRDRLVELLSPFGTIMSVDVVTKPSAHRNGPNVFAFVEFSMREEALHVIEAHNHRIIDGNRVRVEAKDSSAQGPRRFMPDHFVQGITNDTRNVLNHLTRSGLPVDFQQVAFNHPPGGGTTGHTQGLTIRNCPVYSPVQAYPGNSQDYTTAQYGALTPAAAHAARDMARVTATLAQIAAEGEAAGGTISNGSAFAHSGYPYVGLYDHGQNLAMPMHPGSPPIPEPGATMYPAFQQYPQSLAPFQYPQYYPVGYYQYSNGMESVQQAQYFPQSAVSAPEQEQHSGPTSPHSAHQQESDNLVDR